MDTKWKRRSEKLKGFISLAAFAIGLSLTLWSICGVGEMIRTADPEMEWWRDDWQETTAFKTEIAETLWDFLYMAGAPEGDWYSMNGRKAKESVFDGLRFSTRFGTRTETPSAEAMPAEEWTPDVAYKKDDNLLYRVTGGSGEKSYANVGLLELKNASKLPEGYNFYLTFKGNQVYIYKDGQQIDVYAHNGVSNGIYEDPEQWYVPGYTNFPAQEGMINTRVYLAVREKPVKLYSRSHSDIYDVYAAYHACRAQALHLAYLLAAGIALLVLSCILRRERAAAEERLSGITCHVWTEFRFVAVVGFGIAHLFAIDFLWRWDSFFMAFFQKDVLTVLAAAVLWFLTPNNALLCLFWTLWLLALDHRYHPKSARRSFFRWLFGSLRARDLKRPIQKRLKRNAVAGLIAMILLFICLLPVIIRLFPRLLYGYYYFTWWYFVLAFAAVSAVLLLLMIVSAWRGLRLAKDIGLLTDQITSIHSGDLTTTLTLPQDADLRRAAEELADIQSGMDKALQERTQSERMKVELISNVSHDLKTPLTSILSYARLLEEERLTGAAGDYARIILEKANRLNVMVQDVFSISKAASGQLPMKIERIDLSKLLRQTLADMDDAITQSGLTLKVELPEREVEIVADGARLYRVFQNLIQNALQYSLPGSRVYLTLTAAGESATAAVRNTSARELPAGVDFTARFVRGDESRTDGGSGLGLSIAASFTEACGGTFVVETLADLFTAKVTFPLAPVE